MFDYKDARRIINDVTNAGVRVYVVAPMQIYNLIIQGVTTLNLIKKDLRTKDLVFQSGTYVRNMSPVSTHQFAGVELKRTDIVMIGQNMPSVARQAILGYVKGQASVMECDW